MAVGEKNLFSNHHYFKKWEYEGRCFIRKLEETKGEENDGPPVLILSYDF